MHEPRHIHSVHSSFTRGKFCTHAIFSRSLVPQLKLSDTWPPILTCVKLTWIFNKLSNCCTMGPPRARLTPSFPNPPYQSLLGPFWAWQVLGPPPPLEVYQLLTGETDWDSAWAAQLLAFHRRGLNLVAYHALVVVGGGDNARLCHLFLRQASRRKKFTQKGWGKKITIERRKYSCWAFFPPDVQAVTLSKGIRCAYFIIMVGCSYHKVMHFCLFLS